MTEPRGSKLSDVSGDKTQEALPKRPSSIDRAPFSAAQTADVAAHIDDPCDEGGFDQFCRDRTGTLCAFHVEHCHAPDYPCLDLLRHHLAVVFLEDVTVRRRARRALDESGGASND
jgi:hypothetical protein